jgi:site-specific recombinase XerD
MNLNTERSGVADQEAQHTRRAWSTKKKDSAPRGVYRHASGGWAIRYTCGAGHIHKERVGRIKTDATDAHNERRGRARREPSWCPEIERRRERERAASDRAREKARITFGEYAADFVAWARVHHRSWQKDDSRLSRVLPLFRSKKLDEITTADLDRFLGSLLQGEKPLTPASRNRYRDLLSGMFKRAIRLGLVTMNPLKTIPKLKESGGRIVYLPSATKDRPAYEETALLEALPSELRALFTVSLHTGLRWSEQIGLQWRDIDMLTRLIGVGRSKNGYSRQVPMNTIVQSVLLGMATQRKRTDDPTAPVFVHAYRTVARLFEQAVQSAQAALREADRDASRLDGYTWHGNRHSFASRLVMAGVDLLTVQKLGGWRTLSVVQRYAHLAPDHLRSAVERLVARADVSELARNLPVQPAATQQVESNAVEVCDPKGTEG